MKKIALVGILSILIFAWCTQQTPTENTDNLDNFAQCLTEKWAIMYGSVSCSHCQDQKAMFGDSFKKINYVECTQEPERCSKLKGVPTWEFSDGTQLVWLQKFSVLAEKTTCRLP